MKLQLIALNIKDSVPANQKQQAREALVHIPTKPRLVKYNVRINCGNPKELELDLAAIAAIPFDSVTLPKGESAEEILCLMRSIGEDRAYIVTIESLKGLEAVAEIASVLKPGRDALRIWRWRYVHLPGVERIPTYESPLFQQILGIIAITGKRHHLDLFDSVSARFNDPDTAYREARLSRHVFGCTGKKLINPKQSEVINQVFAPSQALITEHLSTMGSFLEGPDTNAHVVGGEYKGMPAFKAADKYIKKLLRQGYLTLSAL